MKILLATDGSAYSEGAARFLSRFNFSRDDEILVLNVISHVPFKDDRESYYAKLKQIKQEIAPRILDSTIDILKPLDVKISTALLDGYPDKAIVDAASESDADLIVMGARGLKGIKSLLIGSVTRSVSINSQRPVMVVKQPQWEATGTLKILYATDGSSSAIDTERLLTAIPFPEDTEITIVNVISSAYIDIPERYWMEVDEKIKDEIAKIREAEFGVSDKIIEDAREVLRGRFSKIKVSIKFGDPSLEILNEAEQSKADLIAVGSSGMRGVKGMLGSVSRSILGHAECSVLIGK
jgi:nucleotide-binding universal stress UspA family protein